jgi:hypothetical protein
MFAGQSMGKAYRPSHFGAEAEPEHPENPALKESRIRFYANRVRMRLPLFEAESAGPNHSMRSLGAA